MAVAPHAAEAWIFDLDNTLYRADSALFDQVDWNMTHFIAAELNLPPERARSLQKQYFRSHGTTLRGLMDNHGIDPHAFLAYVHDIDLSPIDADARLAAALARLGGRKLVHTNGSRAHAERVLQRLGVAHHFEAVFDIADGEFRPKPERASYARLVESYDVPPARSVMVEDLPANLAPARALGMTTVLVQSAAPGADEAAAATADYVTADLPGWLAAVAS